MRRTTRTLPHAQSGLSRARHACRLAVGLLVASLATVPGSAAAQDTRAELRAEQQAERAGHVTPYGLNRAERIIAGLENSALGVAPTGAYPWFGSIYPTGWMAFGAGYRSVFADTGSVNVVGGWSLKNFRMAQASVALPEVAHGRVRVQAHATWIGAPTVPFHGVGQASEPGDKAFYRYREASLGARIEVTPAPWFSMTAAIDHLDIATDGTGTNDSVELAFDPVRAPALLADPAYVRSTISAAIDWRHPPGYSGTGGLYRVELTDYSQQRDGPYSFRLLEAEIVQLIPVLRANWVLALRGMVTTTETGGAEAVPYFLMPSLGGSRNVRGYSTFRFRDRHRILWSAEYRWTPSRFLDMALFYDAGKVTPRRSDLDFSGLSGAYGIGMRVVSLSGTALRVEMARSAERALSLIWTSSASF